MLSWPVQTEIQRIYSPYQLLERMTKPDGLMNILSGGAYYQKVFNLSETNRGHESEDDRYARAYYEFPFNFKQRPERVAIVIPDITRPLPSDRLLPWLFEELGHVPDGNFTIVNGTGSHRANTEDELARIIARALVADYRADLLKIYAVQATANCRN